MLVEKRYSNTLRIILIMFTLVQLQIRGVTGFLGSLKIRLCEERRLEDTQNLKCDARRFQNCLVLTTEDLATKPTKLED